MTATKGPRRRMSEEDFIEHALALIDAEGLDALNVRRLAAALEMSPGALYTYFDNKQALLDQMFRSAMRDLPSADVAGGEPRAELLAAFRVMFAAMARHPGVIDLMMSGVRSPELDVMREHLHDVLARAGLGTRRRVRAISLLTELVLGNVVHSTFRGRSREAEMQRRRSLDPARFPLLAEASGPEFRVAAAETFEFGLVALVDHVLAGCDE